MRWLRIILSFSLFFLVAVSYAQEYRISGRLLDSISAEPVVQAIVYLTPDTSSTYLAYGQSDGEGHFQLHFAKEKYSGALHLHIRHLSYVYKTVVIEEEEIEREWKIELQPADRTLPDVVVTASTPPVVQRSDTTIYDVDAFRDSTEYVVEDVLKKLPGVEVQEDGSIRVYGRDVSAVLVEGTDLFGRRYTMGTKNIRADYIDKVEIIERYEPNPVLKGVNRSEAIALNLKLKDEVKNVLAATVDAAGGFSVEKEGMGFVRVNAFSFSRKLKFMLLSDISNSSSTYSVREMDLMYGSFGTKDVSDEIFFATEFQRFPDTENPGLPSDFVDNSGRSFVTLRSETDLGRRWKMQLNLLQAGKAEEQFTSFTQSFLYEPSIYALSIENKMELKRRLYEGDLRFKYLSENNKQGFQAYFKLGRDRSDARQQIVQTEQGYAINYLSQAGERQRDWFAGGLYTVKLSEKGVGQLFVKSAGFTRPQSLYAENEDFSNLFALPPSFFALNQSLMYRFRGTDVTGRYLWAVDHLLFDVEAFYSGSRTFFSNSASLSDSMGVAVDVLSGFVVEDEVGREKTGVAASAVVAIGAKTSLRLRAGLERSAYRLAENAALEKVYRNAFSSRIKLEYKASSRSNLSFVYTYLEEAPRSEYFFKTLYFSELYELVLQDEQESNEEAQAIALYYRKSNSLKFRSFYFRLRYKFAGRQWERSSSFVQSVLVSNPFFARQGNGLYLTGKFDQFIIPIKTNIKISPSFYRINNTYALDGRAAAYFVDVYRMGVDLGSRILPNWSIYWEGDVVHRAYRSDSGTLRATGMANKLGATYFHGDWRAYVEFFNRFDASASVRTRLTGVKAGVLGRVETGERDWGWGLFLVNLFHAGEFGRIRTGNIFITTSSVEAVPAYFMLNIDYSFGSKPSENFRGDY